MVKERSSGTSTPSVGEMKADVGLWPKDGYINLNPSAKFTRAPFPVPSNLCHDIHFYMTIFWPKPNAPFHFTKFGCFGTI